MVLIEGELRPDRETGNPRTFTRNDGTTGASYEVFARNLRFLSSTRSSSGGGAESMDEGPEMNDEDIPF